MPQGKKMLEPSDQDRAFDAAFGYVAFVLNRHLIHHMLRSSRTLGVDYETLIIWGVLAHQNVAHLLPPGSLPKDMSSEGKVVLKEGNDLKSVRIRDLHLITRIPRETIRRKLEILEKRGFVSRHDRAGWRIVRESVEPDLREFTRESVRQLLACANQIQTALEETLTRLPPRSNGKAAPKRA